MVNAGDARPVGDLWRDCDDAHAVSLGHLHRLFAADPPLGLAILRGLKDWEQGRVCLDVSVGAGWYKVGEWARLGHMGYAGAEDEGIWAAMAGLDSVIGRVTKR